jgi:hypothetical protein
MASMRCFPSLERTLRSTTVTAFLTGGLIGCGNAPAVSSQQAPDSIQDWETEPKFWVPRAILIPRSVPPAIAVDSGADSGKESNSAGTMKSDTTKSDTTGADSIRTDSMPAASTKTVPTKSVAAAKKRDPFPLSPRDSARWPVPGPLPLPGALLPEHRIVAFYGNPLSRRMGILGELDPEVMLPRLEEMAITWAAADSGQKVLPALHLIATVAQSYPGPGRKHRLQMPDSLIEKVAAWAEERGWILILDVQTGLSTVQKELPALVPYLKRPYVHLALDPEFAMKDGKRPGIHMGTMDAAEVNHAVDVLAKLVEEHSLPPKLLVVHRWTYKMLTNSSKIRLDPRVQVVIDMDGYGAPANKKGAYRWFVVRHPVQYAGFKLFFKNDKPVMTPEEVLEMYPRPNYIQYQ